MHRIPSIIALLAAACFALPALAAWENTSAPTQALATVQPVPPPGLTATVSAPYYQITAKDIGAAVAEQMELQAIAPKIEASLNAGSPAIFHSANHPVKIVIHALQIDTTSKRWQAQAYMVAGGKTESIKPIAGTFSTLIEVPVLTRQLGRHDVIEASDISMKPVAERQLRKETVTDAKALIGQSPRAVISANRPIRASEVNAPIIIKKGDSVQMTYTNPYMSIKTSGIALEDGAKGQMIRVKNEKSEKAVSGHVEAAGRVEMNAESAL